MDATRALELMQAEPATDEAWLARALIIVRRIDPDMYRTIRGRWMVHVLADRDELPEYDPLDDGEAYDRDGVIAETSGRHTAICRADVEREARKHGVPTADLLAAVLVHEWEHAEYNSTEYGATLAEHLFLWKMYAAALDGKGSGR
jgi:hypothetical protein